MTMTTINQAIGALKLVPMFINNPEAITRATLIGAISGALAGLEEVLTVTAEFAEVFRAVDAVVLEGQVAYITWTKNPERPYGAVVANRQGHLCATATGSTKEGLAESIRRQLVPQSEGYGEVS